MTAKAKDPERRSRLLRAVAISALFSAFFGGMVVFSGYESGDLRHWEEAKQTLAIAMTATMLMFWAQFLFLYLFTVHKSRRKIEFEHQARLEEHRKVERTKQALKPRSSP